MRKIRASTILLFLHFPLLSFYSFFFLFYFLVQYCTASSSLAKNILLLPLLYSVEQERKMEKGRKTKASQKKNITRACVCYVLHYLVLILLLLILELSTLFRKARRLKLEELLKEPQRYDTHYVV